MSKIADAYSKTNSTFAARTTPGRHVNFIGGHATVLHQEDMPALLRRPDIEIHVEPDHVDWLADWMNKCGFGANAPQAELHLPDGVRIEGEPCGFRLVRDTVETDVPQPSEAPAVPAPKRKGWKADKENPAA